MVNFFNVYGHLMCYSATYGVGVRQSPVTSRQFGPTDLQNTWPTTSLRSPHCIIVLCYASLLLIFDSVEHYFDLSLFLSGSVSTRSSDRKHLPVWE